MPHFLYLILSLIFLSQVIFAEEKWINFKNQITLEMENIPGWCTKEKALTMMELIKKNKCKQCIEIGVFAGKSLFPIAKTLQYNGTGIVYAIDPWEASESVKGFNLKDPNYAWWNNLNYNQIYESTSNLIIKNKLNKFCTLVKRTAKQAQSLFSDNSIDFLHLDGNHNEPYTFQDLITYFPKVKDGGYILLNDANWLSMRKSLVFLLEKTDIISSFSPKATFYVFRKNNKKSREANNLFIN